MWRTGIGSAGKCARVSVNGAEGRRADAFFSNTLTDRLSAMACANAYAARSETAPAPPATGCARPGSGQQVPRTVAPFLLKRRRSAGK